MPRKSLLRAKLVWKHFAGQQTKRGTKIQTRPNRGPKSKTKTTHRALGRKKPEPKTRIRACCKPFPCPFPQPLCPLQIHSDGTLLVVDWNAVSFLMFRPLFAAFILFLFIDPRLVRSGLCPVHSLFINKCFNFKIQKKKKIKKWEKNANAFYSAGFLFVSLENENFRVENEREAGKTHGIFHLKGGRGWDTLGLRRHRFGRHVTI